MKPRLLVSVLHWCDARQTADCLVALERAAAACVATVDVDLLLIDNAAVDGSGTELAAGFPRVLMRSAPENLGYAGGHALALAVLDEVAADALVLVNSDTRFGVDALAELTSAWQGSGAALYLAAEALDAPPGRRHLRFPQRYLDLAAGPHAWFGPRGGVVELAAPDVAPIPVATAWGSVVLIPRELITRYGFLDPAWFLYGEEVDYGLRLRAAGVPTLLVPAATVNHAGRGSSRSQPEVAALLTYYRCRNDLELAWRHQSWAMVAWLAAKKLARAVVATLAGHSGARWWRRGLIDGLRRRRGKVYRPEDAFGAIEGSGRGKR